MYHPFFRLNFLKICAIILFSLSLAYSNENNDETNGSIAWQKETVSATIENINRSNNEVTIEDNDGNTFTVKLDKSINLSDINTGDKVNVVLYRSIATDFHRPTPQELENPLIITSETIKAPEGTEPAAGELRQIVAVVEIVDIDKENHTIKVKGPQGNEYTLKVSDSVNLDNLKESEDFTVTYTESLAASIEKSE